MKVANIILSVLVLIAAAVSAVFSYFLYEKRVALVGGWAQLSDAVHASAVTMDKGSGTAAAKELTSEKLSHKTYASDRMNKALAGLQKQSKALVAQRDALAEALAEVGRRNNAGVNAADLKSFGSYDEQLDKVKRAVAATIDNRNRIYGALRRIIDVDISKLNRGDASGLEPVEYAVRARDGYRSALNSIAGRVGASRMSGDANGARDGQAVYSAVNRKLGEVDEIRRQLDDASRTIYQQKNTIAERDKKIVEINRTVVERDYQIKELKRALGIAPEEPFALWKKGSNEARVHLTGKVTKVSGDYGYIVIDLGSDSVVYQQAGNKQVDINLGLEPGVELVVVRGDEDEFVAAVTLDKVGEKESTANIPVDKVGAIKVGDKIIYKAAK